MNSLSEELRGEKWTTRLQTSVVTVGSFFQLILFSLIFCGFFNTVLLLIVPDC